MTILSQADDLRELRPRFKWLTVIVIASLMIVALRLWYLQVIRGGYFFEFSQSNTLKKVEILAPRGRIFDRNGQIIADSQPSYQVLWNQQYVREPSASIAALAGLLEIPKSEIQETLARERGQAKFIPIVIKSNLSRVQLARVEASKLFIPGIETAASPMRQYLYPYATFHLLGYIGAISPEEYAALHDQYGEKYNRRDYIGKSGIEKIADLELKGIDGGEQVAVDALGRRTDDALFVRDLEIQEPVAGFDVTLTIDIDLQNRARELFEAGGHAGSAVAMRVDDGALLILYSSPSLDPHMFVRIPTPEEWAEIQRDIKNPLFDKSLQGQYPPGSTYKVITATAGLDLKLIDPKTRVFCPGYFQLGGRGRPYRCWKQAGHGSVDLHQALVQSCDVYFYRLGSMVGIERLAAYARKFGLGESTGLGFHYEQKGLVPTKEWKLRARKEEWQEGETLSCAIGQGFNLVTPLQMARAYGALVNGGKLVRPRVLDRKQTPGGEVVFPVEPPKDLEISAEIRQAIMAGLQGVVQEPNGTAHWTRLRDYIHGGKTGTSQVIRIPENQRRLKTHEMEYLFRDHAWFVGFAPVEKPEVVIAVLVEHGGHGSTAAAPIVRDLLLKYFELQASRVAKQKMMREEHG